MTIITLSLSLSATIVAVAAVAGALNPERVHRVQLRAERRAAIRRHKRAHRGSTLWLHDCCKGRPVAPVDPSTKQPLGPANPLEYNNRLEPLDRPMTCSYFFYLDVVAHP